MAQASKCLLQEYEQPQDLESHQMPRTARVLTESPRDARALDD